MAALLKVHLNLLMKGAAAGCTLRLRGLESPLRWVESAGCVPPASARAVLMTRRCNRRTKNSLMAWVSDPSGGCRPSYCKGGSTVEAGVTRQQCRTVYRTASSTARPAAAARSSPH